MEVVLRIPHPERNYYQDQTVFVALLLGTLAVAPVLLSQPSDKLAKEAVVNKTPRCQVEMLLAKKTQPFKEPAVSRSQSKRAGA